MVNNLNGTTPLCTGAVAAMFGVTADYVQSVLRRAGIKPPVVAGRRIWSQEDVLRLRDYLESRGKLRSPEVAS